MKRIRFFSLSLIVFLFLYSSICFSANSKVGTTAYSFLKIGVGARAVALGGAFVGLADDETALFFNPAGISHLGQKSFTLSYNNFLTDIQSGFLGYVHPYSDKSTFGTYINYINYGSFTHTDQEGKNLGTFGAGDFSLGLAYAQTLSSIPMFNFGVTGKFIYGKLQDYSSDALALDLGVLLRFKDNRTKMGFAARNLGFQLKGYTKTHKESLPVVMELGLSHQLRGLPLIFTFDSAKPLDNDLHFDFGGEFLGAKPLIIRVGWSSLGKDFKTNSAKDNLAGFSLGFGVLWKIYRLDYAYSSYADLGGVHRVSISGRI